MRRHFHWPEAIGTGVALLKAIALIAGWVNGWPGWAQVVLAVLLASILGATVGVAGARIRWFGRRPMERHAHRLVYRLHRLWFSDGVNQVDGDYRVSMFVPKWKGDEVQHWERVARSVGEQTECVWPQVRDPAKYGSAGIVVRTFLEGEQSVPGIPEAKQHDPREKDRYLRDSWLDETLWVHRGWRYATMRSYLSRAESGKVLCIFVVERQSGLPIEVQGRRLEHLSSDGQVMEGPDLLAVELQLAADVWATAWGTP